MSLMVTGTALSDLLQRELHRAQEDEASSMARLAQGTRLVGKDTSPSDRHMAETMNARLHALTEAKRTMSDATSLFEAASSGLDHINHMIVRMKELNIAASGDTVDPRSRRFLMMEYQALYDEIERIATTTEYQGIHLLFGPDKSNPEELIFRLDNPLAGQMNSGGRDLSLLVVEDFKKIDTSPQGLGLQSSKDLIRDNTPYEGLSREDVQELLTPNEDDYFLTIYDEALSKLSEYRASYDAFSTRLSEAQNFVDVFSANLSAAVSRISDVNYAEEISALTSAKIRGMAASAMVSHSESTLSSRVNLLKSLLWNAS